MAIRWPYIEILHVKDRSSIQYPDKPKEVIETKSVFSILNSFGSNGWELVTVMIQGMGAMYFLKREVS